MEVTFNVQMIKKRYNKKNKIIIKKYNLSTDNKKNLKLKKNKLKETL